MRRIYSLIILLMTIILFSSTTVNTDYAITRKSFAEPFNRMVDVNDLDRNLNFTRILENIKILSSLGSRVTGYNGSVKAANYIAHYFQKLGLYPGGVNEYFQPYNVAVPIDLGSSVEVIDEGKILKAYALWPNGIQTCLTPPEGVFGKLIDVGRGDLTDFDGKDIEGSVVLMDFNSGDNWLYAARFGAKAVIFIEPDETTYDECVKKFLDVPLYFPRLYVEKKDGLYLRELVAKSKLLSPPQVKISLKMRYSEVRSFNVIGILNGTDVVNSRDIIIVATHYDTWSVVPSLSYGANEAVNVAVLLELAEYLKENPPLKTVWFVVLSGHWQALAGAREFVEKYYFNKDIEEGKVRPLMFISIGPLSSDGKGISLHYTSHFTMVGTQRSTYYRYDPIISLLRKYLSEPSLKDFLKNTVSEEPVDFVRYYFSPSSWWGVEQAPFLCDIEPAVASGGIAFNLRTSLSFRPWLGTPLNDFKSIIIEKLRPQIITSLFIVNSILNEENLNLDWDALKPVRQRISTTDPAGYITLEGEVMTYNLTVGWYTPIPYAIVRVYLSASTYPFAKIVTIADERGKFVVHGLPIGISIPGGTFKMDAWLTNETSGELLYVPDFGLYGRQRISDTFQPLNTIEKKSIVVMRGTSVTIFDPIDPRYQRLTNIRDPRFSNQFYMSTASSLTPLDFESNSEPLIYGYYHNGYEPVSMVFVEPGSKISIVMRISGVKRPIQVFVNASEQYPKGLGLTVVKPLTIDFSIYKTALDIYYLARTRYEVLKSRGVRSLSAEELLNRTEYCLLKVTTDYMNKNYSTAYNGALYAFSMAYRTYNDEVMPLIDDAGQSCLYIIMLIVVSSILLEKLIFAWRGKKMLISLFALSSTLLALFYYTHPALTLMYNSMMALLGVVLIILFIITLVFLSASAESVMKRIEVQILGAHRAETGRIGYVIAGSSLSIGNMKKRRFRATLVFFTIIITAAALLSLTSTSPYTTIVSSPRPYGASYDGILIRKAYGVPNEGYLQSYIINTLKFLVGDSYEVNPRVYLYPQTVYPTGVYTLLLAGENKTARIRALLGLTAKEAQALFGSFLTGPGFTDENYDVCMISNELARVLNVSIADRVRIFGKELTIVGIFKEALVNDLDLDESPFSPIDPDYVSVINKGITQVSVVEFSEEVIALSWREVLIIPNRLALDLGGYISSVSVRPKDGGDLKELKELSSKIALAIDFPMYLGWSAGVFTSQRISSFLFLGWNFIIVPLILCSLNTVMIILASIRERREEVKILSSIGVTPLGLTSIFLLENIIYGFVGSIVGYFVGLSLNRLFIGIGILPPNFTFNFASVSIVLVLLVLQLAILATALYPALLSSRMVTPSLRRKWALPTSPKGDEWNIPLIAKISSKAEATGFLRFLKEYFEGRGATTAFFSIRELVLSLEDMELKAVTNLAPFETRTSQSFTVRAVFEEGGYNFNVFLKRETGRRDVWKTSNYYLIDAIRKQLLIWRTLTATEREKYIEETRS